MVNIGSLLADSMHGTAQDFSCSRQLTKKLEFLSNYFNLSVSDSPHRTSNYLASEILVKINKILSEKFQ